MCSEFGRNSLRIYTILGRLSFDDLHSLSHTCRAIRAAISFDGYSSFAEVLENTTSQRAAAKYDSVRFSRAVAIRHGARDYYEGLLVAAKYDYANVGSHFIAKIGRNAPRLRLCAMVACLAGGRRIAGQFDPRECMLSGLCPLSTVFIAAAVLRDPAFRPKLFDPAARRRAASVFIKYHGADSGSVYRNEVFRLACALGDSAKIAAILPYTGPGEFPRGLELAVIAGNHATIAELLSMLPELPVPPHYLDGALRIAGELTDTVALLMIRGHIQRSLVLSAPFECGGTKNECVARC